MKSTRDKKVVIMKPNDTQTKVALLEQSIEHTNETLIRIEKRFDKIDSRFDEVEKKFEGIYHRMDKINDRIWSNFFWTIGSIFMLSSIIAGIMAKGFHWFN